MSEPKKKETAKKAAVVGELSGKQRRYLRGLAHSLNPVVQIGKQGLTEGVERALHLALEQHELAKVKLLTECPDDKDEIGPVLATKVKAHLAQTIGRTLLYYRRHPKKPTIELP